MENKVQLDNIRHTLAHLLAAAVIEIYPDTKPTIGPTVDNGFYYDFEFTTPVTAENLKDLEKRMRKILPSWKEMAGKEVTKEEANKIFANNPYKLELIEEIASRGEKITLYTCGGFTDLCRGGHAENPAKEISTDAFKLDRVAGEPADVAHVTAQDLGLTERVVAVEPRAVVVLRLLGKVETAPE